MKNKIIALLLSWAGYAPGTVIESGGRKYMIALDGAHWRLKRETNAKNHK